MQFQHQKINWRKAHGWIGVVTCIGILMWAGSGITHPIMTRLQSVPVAFMAPMQTLHLQQTISPDVVLKNAGIHTLKRLSVVQYQNKNYYRVVEDQNTPAQYFEIPLEPSTSNHKVIALEHGDAKYAQFLASHYTGRPESEIVSVDFITEFSTDYHAINQLLPVWRVAFSGSKNLRAFIDTDQSRLSTLVDDVRYTLTQVFQLGHNWTFLQGAPTLQIWLMGGVLTVILISACSGLYLFFSTRRFAHQRLQHQASLKWHRRLGVSVALSTIIFVGSGFYHLIKSNEQAQRAPMTREEWVFNTEDLSPAIWAQMTRSPIQKMQLVIHDGQPHWLLEMAPMQTQVGHIAQLKHTHQESSDAKHTGHEQYEAHSHHAATDSLIPASDKPERSQSDLMLYSRSLALSYASKAVPMKATISDQEIVSTTLITKFGGEYGFLFKRLPVVKVQFTGAGNPRVYIEPATGKLAAHITDDDATEGWVFATIHKWNFVPLGHDGRDLIVVLFALLNITVAGLGLYVLIKKQRQR